MKTGPERSLANHMEKLIFSPATSNIVPIDLNATKHDPLACALAGQSYFTRRLAGNAHTNRLPLPGSLAIRNWPP